MYIRTYICVDITVKFNQSAYNVTENSGVIQLFLILSSPSSFNETVQLISNDVDTDNSAVGMISYQNLCYNNFLCIIIRIKGSVDYLSGSYNITFPIGSTIASLDIIIIDDGVLEDDEMFNVTITSITNGHIVGTPAVATITIIDNTSK